MDKKLLIDNYLEGKHPIGQETWELPTEGELDRDEALYDALLAQNKKASLLGGRFGGGLLVAAAVLIAVVGLFTWRSFTSEPQPQLAEKTTEPLVREVPKSEPPIAQISPSTPITQKTPNTQNNQNTPNTQKNPITQNFKKISQK